MATKKELRVGDRVEYKPTHGTHKLTGVIDAIHDHDDIVEIDRDVDGKLVEVEGIDHAHVSDVKVIEKAKPKATSAPSK